MSNVGRPWESGPPAGAGTQVLERPQAPRPASAWVPPPRYDPAGQAEWERGQRRARIRRGMIAAGIAILAVLLLIAMVVIFKSANDTAASRANDSPNEAGTGAAPGADSNAAPILPGDQPIVPPGAVLPGPPSPDATVPSAPATTIPSAAPPVAPGAPAGAPSGPTQPIGLGDRQGAAAPAQFPSPTSATTRDVTVTQTSARFFLPAAGQGNQVYPGPITFAAGEGCRSSESSIFVIDQQSGNRSGDLGPLSNPRTYNATTVGRYLVELVNLPSACAVTVTYRTR